MEGSIAERVCRMGGGKYLNAELRDAASTGLSKGLVLCNEDGR